MPKRTKLKRTWADHKKQFKNCNACELCQVRTNVVLGKGKLPCDVLFISESPGVSEDILNMPFVGPSGKLLHKIVESVLNDPANADFGSLRFAWTQLIACVPKESKGASFLIDPTKQVIQKCYNRLSDFVELCQPRLIVAVGKVAEKHLMTLFIDYDQVTIPHPARILRETGAMQTVSIQRCQVILEDAFHNLV